MPGDDRPCAATSMKRYRNDKATEFVPANGVCYTAKNSTEIQLPFTDVRVIIMALGRVAQRLRVAWNLCSFNERRHVNNAMSQVGLPRREGRDRNIPERGRK